MVRQEFVSSGVVVSEAVKEKTKEPTKFEQYYDFKEKLSAIPSHRYLAIRRGENEGVLRQRIDVASEPVVKRMEAMLEVKPASPFAGQFKMAIEDSYKRLIAPGIEVDVSVELKMKADRAAVEVFATNLRNLLLSPPMGTSGLSGSTPASGPAASARRSTRRGSFSRPSRSTRGRTTGR